MYVTSSPVATPSPTSAVARRARRPSAARSRRAPAFAACSSAASAASASRAIDDLDLERLGLGLLRRPRRPRRACRGSSVRNSSWLNSTRTCSPSNAPWRELVELDAAVDVEVRARDISRFLNTRSLALAEVLRCFGGSSSRCSKIAFEVAVGRDELGRGLLADAGHAGQVVARVAAQRRVLGVLRGRDAAVRSTMPASS